MSNLNQLPDINTDSEFEGVLMLKKSLFKLRMPAFLCEIHPDRPYHLKIIYYNNEFISAFNLKNEEVLGNNYDFLFDNIDSEYSENHLQYIELLKAVKNFKPIGVNIDIAQFNNRKKVSNYKIHFHPNSFKSEYLYCILTFEKNVVLHKSSSAIKESQDRSSSKSLIQNLERKLRNERVLRIISEVIVSDIPLKEISDSISKILCDHLRVSRCILYDYNNGKTGFVSEYHDKYAKPMVGNGENIDLEPIRKYINFQNKLFNNFNLTKKSNTTLICEDIKNDARFKAIEGVCNKFNIGSQISIVTTFDGKINGGLFLHQPNQVRWYVGEVEFLEIVAEQFSIAIDRSHSLDKVMHANQKLLEKTLQLKKSLKEEKKMRQMQSEFVAMVSHEFKTPLQIIDGTREVLSRKLKEITAKDDSIAKLLDKIKGGVSRLGGLIQSNLNLSQIEMDRDKMKIKKDDFSFKELINDILEKNSNLIINKNIEVICNTDDLPSLYNGDRKLLDHCFTNVITNAVKYSNKDTKIKIFGKKEGKNIIIKVKDSGIGIPKSDLSNIGKKFFRAQNTLAVSGTGIGLYLTKYFVELHNGSVLIESELNKGTLISISLPI